MKPSRSLPFLSGFTVTLDKVAYDPTLTATTDKPYLFVYYITIHNNSSQTLTLKGRKWVVQEASGEVVALEGDGVVGCFPCLAPGEKFSYNSCHAVGGQSVAEGAYLAVTEKGAPVLAKIPRFEMIPPNVKL